MSSTAIPAVPAPLLRAPLHDDGRLALGPALNGSGHAYYQLTTPYRMRHGVIVGDVGAGVSNLVTVLAVTARAAMPLVTAYINGPAALMNPALARQSTVLIDGEDVAGTAIAALERAVAARAALLASMRAGTYPAAGLPALLVVIKDAHRVFDGHGQRWTAVVREAGKLGIGVLATVHDTWLTSFGGSRALRALLVDEFGQLVALRTADPNVTTAVVAGRWPAAEPGTPPTGVGRVIYPEAGRGEFASFRLAAGGTGALVERGRRRWLVTYPDTELDGPTRAAFGDLVRRGAA